MTEQEAINQCLSGNMDAFATLYDLYIQKVYRFVYYRVGHKQVAEDLVSVVFTKAFSKFHTYNPKLSFQAWILSIARNTVIDHYRTKKATFDIEEAFNVSDQTNLSKDYELREKIDQVRKYLQGLDPEQRDLVIMRLWDGLAYEEISKVLGKSEATLRVNFSRILSKMQKELILALVLVAIVIGT